MKHPILSDQAIPVRHYVGELLEYLGLEEAQLAEGWRGPRENWDAMLDGEQRLSPELADYLASRLPPSAQAWLNLSELFFSTKAIHMQGRD